MFPFIETVRIENGQPYNLSGHNQRLNATRREVLGCKVDLDLADYLTPETCQVRTKCRIEYVHEIEKVDYQPYQIRPVGSLKLVSCDRIDYHYKSTDRRLLNELFDLRGQYDDILIVREGLLTDTSVCNIAFWNGGCWFTPEEPLLSGTMRSLLLDQNVICTAKIRPEDLSGYSVVRLFNALIDFGEIEFLVNEIYI